MENNQNEPRGLAGWLLLVGLVVILSPLYQFASGFEFLGFSELLSRQSGLDGPFRALVLGEVVLSAVLLAWSLVNVFLFFGKKVAFPLSWLGFVWGALFWRVIDLVAVDAIVDLPITPQEWGQLAGAFLGNSLWSAYLVRSRRVKNTFVEPVRAPFRRLATRTGAGIALALPGVAFLGFLAADSLRPVTPRDVAASARAAFVSISGYLDEAPSTNGSGFLVSRDGLIVTNLHVLQGSEQIEIVLPDGEVSVDPTVLAIDEAQDLALLKVEVEGYQMLPLGDDEALAVGDTVFVLGNPLGMEQTFSDGLVSALRVDEDFEWLQISAPISEGSSGGPVLNRKGEVVGVSTSYVPGGQNLNLAVPSRFVRRLMAADYTPAAFSTVALDPAFASSDTVLGRRMELERVSSGLPETTRAAFSDLQPWEQAIHLRAADYEQALAPQGWTLAEDFEVSVLEADHYESYELTLDAGSYTLVAVCDNDCTDLDLGVEWAGQALIQDTELDANPLVQFELEGETTITVYASMIDCEAETCGYMADIYLLESESR